MLCVPSSKESSTGLATAAVIFLPAGTAMEEPEVILLQRLIPAEGSMPSLGPELLAVQVDLYLN